MTVHDLQTMVTHQDEMDMNTENETANALSAIEADSGNLIIALTPMEEAEANQFSIDVNADTQIDVNQMVVNQPSMEVDIVNEINITHPLVDTCMGNQSALNQPSEATEENQNEIAQSVATIEHENQIEIAQSIASIEHGNHFEIAQSVASIEHRDQIEIAQSLSSIEHRNQIEIAQSIASIEHGNQIEIAQSLASIHHGNQIDMVQSVANIELRNQIEMAQSVASIDHGTQIDMGESVANIEPENQIDLSESVANIEPGNQIDLTESVVSIEHGNQLEIDQSSVDIADGGQLHIDQAPNVNSINQLSIHQSTAIDGTNNQSINQMTIDQTVVSPGSKLDIARSIANIDNEGEIAIKQITLAQTSNNQMDIIQTSTEEGNGNQLDINQSSIVITPGNQIDLVPSTTDVSHQNQTSVSVAVGDQEDMPQSTSPVNVENQISINHSSMDVTSGNQIVITQPSIDETTANHLIKMEVDNENQIVISRPSIVVADGNHIPITQTSGVDTTATHLTIEPQSMDVTNSTQIPIQTVDGIQTANGVTRSEAETITINLPTSTIQNLQLNGALNLPNSPVAVLQTDYMNILDIVLNNSKLSLQGNGMDGNQAIVLAEVERNSGEMIAVKGVDGHHIALTPQQLNALNVAASSGGGDLSIVTSEARNNVLTIDTTDVNNQEKNSTLIPAITDMKENLAAQQNPSDMAMKDDNGDEIEFEDIDDDPFEVAVNSPPLDEKPEPIGDGRSEIKFKCSECGKPYVTKAALKKHLNVVHGKEVETTMQKGTSRCIHPGCDKIFYHRQKMIDHLKEEHGVNCVQEDLVFNSWDEFFIWKEKEEDANFVHFSKNSTHTNTPNYMLTNFTCQREGKAGYKYKGSQQKKYKDLVIGEKICPARMRARLDKPTGRVTVQYCKSHNHKLSFQDFLYRRMPDRLRNEIREKLLAGMSSEEIYKELKSTDNLRESRGERFAPSKRQFVTLINIKTIAKRMQIKETGPPKNFVLDPDPYAIQMQKLLDETYNPVLLYKDQGVHIEVGPEEIEKVIPNGIDLLLIAIQTKEQKEMFLQHGHKIVFIDITEAIVSPTQYVVTVKVLDEYNKGYPVAFLLSNSRDETVLFYFFREIQARVAESGLKINAVMTENSCNEYYAFRSVFGDHVKHLLCKWNLHRAWCQKIHEECAGDEALQQELYFIFVTMLEEQDLAKFESIATEFVNNYQVRCPNFITFFMSNYLSQPEVWASCYRNNPFSDCDEILYGDRLHERIKKEIKNNHKVKSLDDILDLVLKFEHEDYFNRGLNLMLNPPEGDLVLSEHSLGMKIKNTNVVENYTADNRWLVKTTKRDPSDLQNIKEESYRVTWKADICEKDFCRERCLKLTCFGLCGHLYHCSCDVTTVTPCSHIHKVHSLRIGVSQYQNEEKEAKEADELCAENMKGASGSNDNALLSVTDEKDDGKLNLINQVSSTGSLEPDNRTREEKIRKIKLDLVKMYKFLESDNIQKYSLDFIDAGLKKVIDECKVIDSIGQGKSLESFQGKRKSTVEDVQDFEMLVKYTKRRRVMGNSVPVIVEIEPNPATYNTFRKRITGDAGETPEDRMLRLSKSKNITVNIESDDKFRRNHSQQVTSTPGIIVAKEGESSSLKVEAEEVMQQDLSDTEWTPKSSSRRGRSSKGKSTASRRRSVKAIKPVEMKIPHLDKIPDPLKEIIINGSLILNMTHLKVLDAAITPNEIEKCQAFSPGWDQGVISDIIVDSYFYVLSQKYNILSLTVEQMHSLCNNEPHITRFWDPEEIDGDKSSSYIFVPWKNPKNYFCLFVIDLKNHCITFLDAGNSTQEVSACDSSQVTHADMMHMVNRAHTTLIGLMITEIPFDSTRVKQLTWPLTIDTEIEFDNQDPTLRCMWYAHRLCNNTNLIDKTTSMYDFRKVIYDNIVGTCLERIVDDKMAFCPVCNSDAETSIECTRCGQMYHVSCLKDCNMEGASFVCINLC